MSTRPLDARKIKDLQPGRFLWAQVDAGKAPYRFRARVAADVRPWQRTVRKALMEQIGFQDAPRVAPAPRRIERVDRGEFIREKILIRTSPWSVMPLYLLLPKRGRGPFPVVLAFSGHGYGVKDIVGLWEDGSERRTPDGYHKDFAVELCRRGFAVAAPEIACFGEKSTDFSALNTRMGQPVPGSCAHAAMLAFYMGKSPLGLRVLEARRLVDYLQTRPECNVKRLGAMGISGGGLHTMFSTCVDERIKACVISGYYSTFKDSILALHHCFCNMVPGLARFGEMYDLIGLIAPRPVLVEAGRQDNIFPIAAVRRSVAIARRVYGVVGAADAVETDIFEGRHRISGRRAYDFLWDKLA